MAASLPFVPIQNSAGRTFEKLDIRFVKDNISVLIETKQVFTRADEEQLSAYVEYEKALTGNKIVAILANTTNDSVLSTFLQEEPFYSGRDLYLLIPKYSMSKLSKLFCITVLKANRYRYSYGRQANITLPHLELMLPVDGEGKPNFPFMENYMKALPYGDRI